MKTISDAQRDSLTLLAKQDLIAHGVAPGTADIQDWIIDNYGTIAYGKPTTKLFRQERGQAIDVKAMQLFFKTVAFDLHVAHEILRIDTQESVNAAIQNTERFFDLQSNLNELQEQADALLDAVNPDEPVSEAITVDMVNHKDPINTTALVDLEAGQMQLHSAFMKTTRYLPATLTRSHSPRVVLSGVKADKVLRSSQVEGAGFVNCITDTDKPWLHEIELEGHDGQMTAELVVLFTNDRVNIPLINKIEMEPVASQWESIEVNYSPGGDSYVPFGTQNIKDQVAPKVVMTTKPVRISSIKIKFTLSKPSTKRNGISTYVIGLQALRFFDSVYRRSEEFVSTALTPTARDFISQVKLEASHHIPEDTSIEYYIKLANDSEETDWAPIVAGGDPVSLQSAFIYNGSTIPVDDNGNPINPSSYPSLYRLKGAHEFYKVGEIPSDRSIDSNTAELIRAVGHWRYSRERNIVAGSARDIYLNFAYKSTDRRQDLYVWVVEDANIVGGTVSGTSTTTSLVDTPTISLSHEVSYNSAANSLYASASNPSLEADATYAIAWVRKKSSAVSSQRMGGAIVNETSGKIFLEPGDSFGIDSVSDDTILYVESESGDLAGYVFVVGKEGDRLEIQSDAAFGVAIPPIASIPLTYWRIDTFDLTKLVKSIDKRVITFRDGTILRDGDEIEVCYRAKVGDRIWIDPNSLQLRNKPGNTGDLLTEGTDYKYDPLHGAVAGTRGLPQVRTWASFTYTREASELFSISAWFGITEAKKIELADLSISLDYESGEGIFFQGVNNGNAVAPRTVLELPVGWHKVAIKATTMKRLETVKSIRTVDGSTVFTEGAIFAYHYGIRTPLRYVDIGNLLGQAKIGEVDSFSVLGDGSIIVPFNPLSNSLNSPFYDVYKGEAGRVLENNSTITSEDSLQPVSETMRIKYNYVPVKQGVTSGPAITAEILSGQNIPIPLQGVHLYDRIFVKAKLRRTSAQNAKVTPTIQKIKVGIK